MRQGVECRGAYLCARQDIKSSPCFQDLRSDRAFFGSDAILVQSRYLLSSVLRSLPDSMQAPALLQSHGGGVGITSDGGQVVVSCGDLPEPWISNDHKHAVISLR